jgi:hypothetical protein
MPIVIFNAVFAEPRGLLVFRFWERRARLPLHLVMRLPIGIGSAGSRGKANAHHAQD